jgi:hypothetical protein
MEPQVKSFIIKLLLSGYIISNLTTLLFRFLGAHVGLIFTPIIKERLNSAPKNCIPWVQQYA